MSTDTTSDEPLTAVCGRPGCADATYAMMTSTTDIMFTADYATS